MRIGRIGVIVGSAALLSMDAGVETIARWRPGGLAPQVVTGAVLALVAIGMPALATWRCHDFNETFWHVYWIDQAPFIGQAWGL